VNKIQRTLARNNVFDIFKHPLWFFSITFYWRIKIPNGFLEMNSRFIWQLLLVQSFLKKVMLLCLNGRQNLQKFMKNQFEWISMFFFFQCTCTCNESWWFGGKGLGVISSRPWFEPSCLYMRYGKWPCGLPYWHVDVVVGCQMVVCHVASVMCNFVLVDVASATCQVQIGGILIFLQKLFFFKWPN